MIRALSLLLALAVVGPAAAEDNVLLIQLQPGGGYTIWHTEGETELPESEAISLEATATPEGGPVVQTTVGAARAYETANGIIIRIPSAPKDNALLLDRDNCGHVRLWHAAGATQLSDDEATDIFMSAVPGGGKRLVVGDRHVKAFLGPLGVTASFWPMLNKPRPSPAEATRDR